MADAALVELPHMLRDIFVQLLVHCSISDPLTLWTSHKTDLAADLRLKTQTDEEATDGALFEIDKLLEPHGVTGASFGLPPPRKFDQAHFDDRHMRQALAFNADAAKLEAAKRVPQLNTEQRVIFDAVMDAINNPDTASRGRAFYVDGPGGSGKTFLYETIIEQTHSQVTCSVKEASFWNLV